MLGFKRRDMISKWSCLALLAAAIFAGACAAQTAQAPVHPQWALTWSDEFNGQNGAAADVSKWVTDVGGNGWGNDELEYYTNRLENAHQQDGNLVIKIVAEKHTGADGVTRNYTSARL